MHRRLLPVVALAALSTGCSDDVAAVDENRVSFSAELNVAPGEETIQCQFVTMPTDRGEMAVRHSDHSYTAGSHHFLLFRTDIADAVDIPEGGTTLTECEEGDQAWMGHVRGVVYAAQEPEGAFGFPEGVGMTFQPGEVLLMQSHYLNATPDTLDARIDVGLDLIERDTVAEEAGVIFYYNPAVVVPPMGQASATLSCPVPAEVNLAFATSHMHKRGTRFEATTDDAAVMASVGATLYETNEWAEPLPRVFDESSRVTLSKGSAIRYTCDFDNPDPFTVVQGPSADTNEMCMFIGMYWPKQNETFEWCYDGVTDSVGTASGADTLGCLIGCAGEPECSGDCWNDACPNAAMKIPAMRDCLPSCVGACAAGVDSEACRACTADICPDEYDDLIGATCQ